MSFVARFRVEDALVLADFWRVPVVLLQDLDQAVGALRSLPEARHGVAAFWKISRYSWILLILNFDGYPSGLSRL